MLNGDDISLKYCQEGYYVKISEEIRATWPGLQSFGECGDRSCTCHRLTRPWVRDVFKECVVKSMGRGSDLALHYVSLGSGSLLADLEILCALQATGHRIESCVFVDTSYSTVNSVQWEALRAIAAYLGGHTRIAAYPSTVAFAVASLLKVEKPATLFVQMDVSAIRWEECATVSAFSLAPWGIGFRLDNPTRHATLSMWRRRPEGVSHSMLFTAPGVLPSTVTIEQLFVRRLAQMRELGLGALLEMLVNDEELSDGASPLRSATLETLKGVPMSLSHGDCMKA